MKKFIFLFYILTIVLVSCRDNRKTTSIANGDSKFQQLSEDYISGYLAWRPELSVFLGFHEYDGKTSDFSKESIENELARLKKYNQMLHEIDSNSFSPKMYYDFRILQHGIKNEIFNFGRD